MRLSERSPSRSRRSRLSAALWAILALTLPLASASNGLPDRPDGRGDGASRISRGDEASEYWDLTVRLDSGPMKTSSGA